MRFSNSYFEDEVRDGFYVPGMVKRAWAAQLEVLEDVDRVCKKHGIRYFADWGTLLGAVRHGGFIPWDDDLDICMKRQDYTRFLEIAPKELPAEYKILNFHTPYNGEFMWQFISRIVNHKSICFDEKHLEKFHDFPYVAGIDIYPLDYRASSEEKETLRGNLLTLVTYAINLLEEENGEQLEEQLCIVEDMCNVRINRDGTVKQQLYCLSEQLISLYREEEAQIITRMMGGIDESKCRYPKSWYQETIMLPFENTEIPVPLYYDAVLKSLYGEYLKPFHGGGEHEYPFYKKQEAVLPERFGIRPVKYEIPGHLICPAEN